MAPRQDRWVAVDLIVVYLASLFAILELWRPQIQRRRFDGEMREDPVGAAERRKRERTWRLAGRTAALVAGALVIVLLLWLL